MKNSLLTLAVGSFLLLGGCREEPSEKPPQPEAHADEHDHVHDHDHAAEHGPEIHLTADAVKKYGVKIDVAALRTLRPTFLAPARIAFNGDALAHIGSPLPGRVVELPVKLGDAVKKGDTLLTIESPELGEAQNDFYGKRIEAQAAVSSVELAKNVLDRVKALYDENRSIALNEVQTREAEYRKALAAQQVADSAVVAAENKLHLLGMQDDGVDALIKTGKVQPRFAIRAPLDGEVVEREVTLGELVNPEKERLLALANMETLWVLADVPEARVRDVVLGAPAYVRAGGLDSHKHEGSVSYISPIVDARTRSAQVRVAIECDDRSLWPGMFVQIEIVATDRSAPEPAPVVAVPDEALQMIENQATIFVPVSGEENTFMARTVSIGNPTGGLVPVYSGLVDGEQYVAEGSFILKAELGKGTAEHVH
ncbi:MAG TPA: efflux RND transporter periplasmic adaptor subunit [Phycisphaerae bacterium]|nr:efflux RND transporter periplasmic adaptor subunit [Phycisphaerae bacterium]